MDAEKKVMDYRLYAPVDWLIPWRSAYVVRFRALRAMLCRCRLMHAIFWNSQRI